MKKYAFAFTALILVSAFTFAQVPKTTPILPAVDAASVAALAPIATEKASLQKQLEPIQAQLKAAIAQWRVIEGKALATAGLDPGMYQVSADGTKFVPRQGPPR